MTPEQSIETIEAAYASRLKGDKASLRSHWAPGAQYRFAADGRLLPGFPAGPQDAASATEQLIDLFTFHELQPIATVAAGDRVAIHWKAKLSYADGPVVETELLDLWRLTEDGHAAELVQFGDSALVARLMAPAPASALAE